MDLYEELGVVVDALHAAGVEFALCGGVAVALYGHVRFTKDIDLLIRPSDLDRATAALAGIGFTIPGGRVPISSGEWFRVSKAEGDDLLPVDLLLATDELKNSWQDRELFEWEGRRLPVVSLEQIILMKRRAGRPQDLVDLQALESRTDDPSPDK